MNAKPPTGKAAPALPRGTPRLRDILFTRASAPLIDHFRPRRWITAAAIACGLLPCGAFAHLLHTHFKHAPLDLLADTLALTSILCFIAGELLCALAGIRSAALSVGLWKRQHRLTELRLTRLRPIEIAQIVFGADLRNWLIAIGVAYAGFVACLLWHAPSLWPYTLLYGLLAANAAVTTYVFAWFEFTLSLALGLARSLAALLFLTFTLYLAILPVTIPVAITLKYSPRFANTTSGDAWLFSGLLFVSCLWSWTVKVALARAYAARLEQVVFPRLEE